MCKSVLYAACKLMPWLKAAEVEWGCCRPAEGLTKKLPESQSNIDKPDSLRNSFLIPSCRSGGGRRLTTNTEKGGCHV
jgi:hypothetical protein